MKDLPRVKGLGDLRTVTTHHIPSKPPRKGTTYLDIFALSMERQRLEQELAGIERRRKRVLDRLTDAGDAIERLQNEAKQEQVSQSLAAGVPLGPQVASMKHHQGGPWKKIPLEY